MSEKTLQQEQLYAESFQANDPFKHVLMEDFFEPVFLQGILAEFPDPGPKEELKNEFGSRSRKHAVHDIAPLGDHFKAWDSFLRSRPFIKYMERVTGIPDLIFDPIYHGAGTHNNMSGQGMDVHVDFNLHPRTGYHRRLNLIIYLNPEWQDDWGGTLELHKDPWEPEHDYCKRYLPLLNHAVLFETNEYSWHGFDHIKLPEDKQHLSRKSLTVYYYSETRPAEEIVDKHTTIYVQKSKPKHLVEGVTLTADDVAELELLFKHRNNYLKGMYQRESQLQTQIIALKKRVDTLNKGLVETPLHTFVMEKFKALLGRGERG